MHHQSIDTLETSMPEFLTRRYQSTDTDTSPYYLALPCYASEAEIDRSLSSIDRSLDRRNLSFCGLRPSKHPVPDYAKSKCKMGAGIHELETQEEREHAFPSICHRSRSVLRVYASQLLTIFQPLIAYLSCSNNMSCDDSN